MTDNEARARLAERYFELNTEKLEWFSNERRSAHSPPTLTWDWLPIMLRKMSEPGKPVELSYEQKRDRKQFDIWYDAVLSQCSLAIRLIQYFEDREKPEPWGDFIEAVRFVSRKYSGWKQDGRIKWLPNSYRLKSDEPTAQRDTDCVDALAHYLGRAE